MNMPFLQKKKIPTVDCPTEKIANWKAEWYWEQKKIKKEDHYEEISLK